YVDRAVVRCTWTIIHRRQWHGWTNRRLDGLRAAERARQDCGPRPGRRHEPLGDQYRDLLHRLVAGCVELHHHAAQHAYKRHVADAYAADLLGVVHDCGARVVVVSGAARRRHSAPPRSYRGHELLYSEWPLRERLAFGLKPEF